MDNLKKPEEYLNSLYTGKQGSNKFVIKQDIIDLIKKAQRDAYNQAIDDVLNDGITIKTSGYPSEMFPNGLMDDEYSYDYVNETYSYADRNLIKDLKIE